MVVDLLKKLESCAFRCGDVLVGSGSVGACHGVELSLLLFVLGCKFIGLKLNEQKKLK